MNNKAGARKTSPVDLDKTKEEFRDIDNGGQVCPGPRFSFLLRFYHNDVLGADDLL